MYTLCLQSARDNFDPASIKRLDDNCEESLHHYRCTCPEYLKVVRSALSCQDQYALESFSFLALDPKTTSITRSSQAASFSVPLLQSSYVDGIGYSTNVGMMDDERVIRSVVWAKA
ncbi:predicted protein [Lichtheimia corymbifera JMRC:FSU:9682]|uniref:Uncharacterized protein n=1 Tax=Lichtheimia corymbifera JMRC:FSU:9682 TaxID=1263082 RepID=A0A068RKX9_9FUNG|nr:predicted protein [Lichtheimia corymbifera JMRC:FSU:9682]